MCFSHLIFLPHNVGAFVWVEYNCLREGELNLHSGNTNTLSYSRVIMTVYLFYVLENQSPGTKTWNVSSQFSACKISAFILVGRISISGSRLVSINDKLHNAISIMQSPKTYQVSTSMRHCLM